MTADELASALAHRLALLVPSGWAVSAEPVANKSGLKPGDLAVFCDGTRVGGSFVRQFFDAELRDQYPSEAEMLVDACKHALSDVQDAVCDGTTEAWPGKGPPNPRVRIAHGHILASFGEESGPFSLDPIPISPGSKGGEQLPSTVSGFRACD